MKNKFILTVVFTLLSLPSLFAHALWIETNNIAKTGQQQEVKIFLGEYAANERDAVQDWFIKPESLTLWLVAPDGKKSQLNCTSAGNHLKANFIPTESGVYYLSVDHYMEKVWNSGKRGHYHAIAMVNVNQSLKGKENLSSLGDFVLQVDSSKTQKLNTPVASNLLFKKAAPTNGELVVQSPTGWSKSFKADEKGMVIFEPVWQGKYMLEGTFAEEAIGKLGDKEYKGVWHCVTFCLDAK